MSAPGENRDGSPDALEDRALHVLVRAICAWLDMFQHLDPGGALARETLLHDADRRVRVSVLIDGERIRCLASTVDADGRSIGVLRQVIFERPALNS